METNMAHRTQLYLEDDQFAYLKELSRAQGKSIAAIVRGWIDKKRDKRNIVRYKNDSFWKLRGIFGSGQSDIARNFDDYLYGDKK